MSFFCILVVLQSRTNPASVTWKGGAVLGIHDFKNHGYIARTGSGTGFILVDSSSCLRMEKRKIHRKTKLILHLRVYEGNGTGTKSRSNKELVDAKNRVTPIKSY
ncbi:hypothetical protein ACS0TY_019973 [Phlomoides rotata]